MKLHAFIFLTSVLFFINVGSAHQNAEEICDKITNNIAPSAELFANSLWTNTQFPGAEITIDSKKLGYFKDPGHPIAPNATLGGNKILIEEHFDNTATLEQKQAIFYLLIPYNIAGAAHFEIKCSNNNKPMLCNNFCMLMN